MKRNKELRAETRAVLSENWMPAIITFIAFFIIQLSCIFLLNNIFSMSESVRPQNMEELLAYYKEHTWYYITQFFVYILLLNPLTYGYTIALLLYFRGEKDNCLENTFIYFAKYKRSVSASFFVSIYTMLWLLLLIVPGIIKMLSYSMTYYIVHDNPEISINKAINLSTKMMKGHKRKLFLMNLHFIGLMLLSTFTLFIALWWIIPYMAAAQAAFYEDLKSEYANKDV